MEGFLGLPESHESRVVVLMLAENDDNPTAICPIVHLPHTQSPYGLGCRAIADNGGGEGRMRLAVFQRRVRSSARENFCCHRPRTALGHRNVAFWTDDPYFRLRPEVANPSALSARLLKNPTEGQVPTSQTYPRCFTV